LFTSDDKLLDKIADNLRVGDLQSAVAVASSARGSLALPMKDWLRDANDRLAAEETITALKAHGSILNFRCIR
jgi:hypothetical protein